MTLRDSVQAAGRVLTRALLHPRWRQLAPVANSYLSLYLAGKRLTEKREMALLQTLVEPGMTIADIGANVGFYAVQMGQWVGASGRVLAFEPDPLTFELLQRRSSAAAPANLEVRQFALGDARGTATLYCSAYNRADNRVGQRHDEPNVEAIQIEVRTLDEYLAERGLPAVDALKIDVQGLEAHVLRGAAQTISRVRWIWLEFSPDHLRGAGTDPEAFLESLAALGMKIFEVTQHGTLEPLTDYRAHAKRLGSGYGDLVLMREPPRRSAAAPAAGAPAGHE
jgi:FkbM family methyltransferase